MGLIDDLEKQKAELIRRNGESFDEMWIFCPYCAHEQEDTWEWNIRPDEEESEEQCQKCDRHFAVSARIVFSTRRLK